MFIKCLAVLKLKDVHKFYSSSGTGRCMYILQEFLEMADVHKFYSSFRTEGVCKYYTFTAISEICLQLTASLEVQILMPCTAVQAGKIQKSGKI